MQNKYNIVIEENIYFLASTEEEAYEKYFEALSKNNETAETHLTSMMKIKQVYKNEDIKIRE